MVTKRNGKSSRRSVVMGWWWWTVIIGISVVSNGSDVNNVLRTIMRLPVVDAAVANEGEEGHLIRGHRHLQSPSSSSSFATSELKAKFEAAKAQFITKLEQDYGKENVATVFFPEERSSSSSEPKNQPSIARTVVETTTTSTTISWERMRNKVAMKILQAQMEQKAQPFVWATGGHSASAGHGNLFNESYTAVLEQNAHAMFAAVGLDWTARNRAMGAASCGMELNNCIKEVFGIDIDVLSWDYGMTTGDSTERVELYFHRAAMLPQRPYFVAINIGRASKVLPTIEALGPAMFHLGDSLGYRIPDSKGKTAAELDDMPPLVRCFRWGKAIEGDECTAYKYSRQPDDPCDKRKGKASWHPGWKWHALYGNMLTLFWMEIISDALEEISLHGSDPATLLQTLKRQQDADYAPLFSKNATNNIHFVDKNLDQNISDIPNEVVYWSPNLCHTARVPAQTRYLGILTESNLNSGSYQEYDHGSKLSDVRETVNPQMPLSWDPHQYQEFCQTYEIEIDHQDFFVVNSQGWSSLTLPNAAEKSYYLSDGTTTLMGYIALCSAFCGWSCPPGVLGYKEIMDPSIFTVEVNGQAVTGFSYLGNPGRDACVFFQHSQGHQWTANPEGQYEIRAKTLDPSKYARISSFIIW